MIKSINDQGDIFTHITGNVVIFCKKLRQILLVEDNELNREIAVALLSEYGFQVDTAEDGAEAVEKVKNSTSGDYDLVLMDVQMPVMNGYEATERIRSLDNPSLAGITILAMTVCASRP